MNTCMHPSLTSMCTILTSIIAIAIETPNF